MNETETTTTQTQTETTEQPTQPLVLAAVVEARQPAMTLTIHDIALIAIAIALWAALIWGFGWT